MAQFRAVKNGTANYRIISPQGKVIAKGSQKVEVGKNLLNLGNLKAAAGNYILQVEAEGQQQQIQFNWN